MDKKDALIAQLADALELTLKDADGWHDECRGMPADRMDCYGPATAALAAAGRRMVKYPPIEEVLGFQVAPDPALAPALAPGQFALRPPQADVIRHMPAGPVADTMDHAQLAALGRHVLQKKGEHG